MNDNNHHESHHQFEYVKTPKAIKGQSTLFASLENFYEGSVAVAVSLKQLGGHQA